jgi:hypothetical protein
MEEIRDVVDIGVTPDGEETLKLLTEEKGWFNQQQAAARFALALALKEKPEFKPLKNARTKWAARNIASEEDGLVDAVKIVYPDIQTPYKLLEFLIDRGLSIIQEENDHDPHISLEQILDDFVETDQQ